MGLVEVTRETFDNLLETWINESSKREHSINHDMFWCKDGDLYLGADNTRGDFYVEEFSSKEMLFLWFNEGILPANYEVVKTVSNSGYGAKCIIYTIDVGLGNCVDVMYCADEDSYCILEMTDGWNIYQTFNENDEATKFFFDADEVINIAKEAEKKRKACL